MSTRGLIDKINSKLKKDAMKQQNHDKNGKKVFYIMMNDKRLKEIPKIENAKSIRVAYFCNNMIEKINLLNEMTNLTHLYLQFNKIDRIVHFDLLQNLQKLFLGYNCISVVENLENLKKLQELNIEKQDLENGESLCFEPKCLKALGKTLQVLNISGNFIQNTNMIVELNQLKEFHAKDNKIEDFETFAKNIKNLFYLRLIDCRGNPMCSKHRYKETIIAYCFKLELIDEKVVTDMNRKFIKCFEKKRNLLLAHGKVDTIDMQTKTNISPDSLLSMLEANRDAKEKARQLKIQQMASCPMIPRCFWRNRTTQRCKDSDNNIEDNNFGNITLH